MKGKVVIATIAAFLISGWGLSGPDPFTAIVLGFAAAILCCVPLLILAGRKFVQRSPNAMQTLVCVLVCMVAVLLLHYVLLVERFTRPRNPPVVSSPQRQTSPENGVPRATE
jgi:hypothetical protein